MKLGFIGCGNMASAMIGGIIKNQVVAPADILASAKTEVSREKKKEEDPVNRCYHRGNSCSDYYKCHHSFQG